MVWSTGWKQIQTNEIRYRSILSHHKLATSHNDALNFDKQYENRTDEKIKMIRNASKSIIINQDEIWIKTKKNNNRNPLIDITMGENMMPKSVNWQD